MSTLTGTDAILAALKAIDTYYIEEDDGSYDLVDINPEIEVRAIRRSKDWRFVATLRACGDGGIELLYESKECSSPDEAIENLGNLFDDKGFIVGTVNKGLKSETEFFIGPYSEDLALDAIET